MRGDASGNRGSWGAIALALLVVAILALTYAFGRYAGGGVTSMDTPITTGQGTDIKGAPSGAAGPRR